MQRHLVCPGVDGEDVPDAEERLRNGVEARNQLGPAPRLRSTDPMGGGGGGGGRAGFVGDGSASGDAVARPRDDGLEQTAGGSGADEGVKKDLGPWICGLVRGRLRASSSLQTSARAVGCGSAAEPGLRQCQPVDILDGDGACTHFLCPGQHAPLLDESGAILVQSAA